MSLLMPNPNMPSQLRNVPFSASDFLAISRELLARLTATSEIEMKHANTVSFVDEAVIGTQKTIAVTLKISSDHQNSGAERRSAPKTRQCLEGRVEARDE